MRTTPRSTSVKGSAGPQLPTTVADHGSSSGSLACSSRPLPTTGPRYHQALTPTSGRMTPRPIATKRQILHSVSMIFLGSSLMWCLLVPKLRRPGEQQLQGGGMGPMRRVAAEGADGADQRRAMLSSFLAPPPPPAAALGPPAPVPPSSSPGGSRLSERRAGVRCHNSTGERPCDGAFALTERREASKGALPMEQVQACIDTWGRSSQAEQQPPLGGASMKAPAPSVNRSAFDEDLIVFRALFDDGAYRPGFFIELGAYDGLRESNTRFFETCLGWEGLLIEAQPGSYAKLQANAWLRPRSHLLLAAPSCPHDFRPVLVSAESSTGMSLHDTIQQQQSPPANDSSTTAGDPKKKKKPPPVVPVQCGSLSFWLDELGVRQVDFLSLDVEGFDLQVLQGVDFRRHSFRVIMVETYNRLYKRKEFEHVPKEIKALLVANGFVDSRISVGKSHVFVRAKPHGT